MNTDEFNSDDDDHLMAEISSDIEEEADQPIFDKNDLLIFLKKIVNTLRKSLIF